MALAHVDFIPMPVDEARTVLYRHANTFSRLPVLIKMQWRMEMSDWLTLLGEFWSDFDNIAQHADILIGETPFADVVERPGEFRHWLMSDAERQAFEALPDEITVYRGCYAHNKWGLSWSLDSTTAERFLTLHRYQRDGQPLLVKATIPKTEAIALKLDRGESEIIALRPRHRSTRHIRPATISSAVQPA